MAENGNISERRAMIAIETITAIIGTLMLFIFQQSFSHGALEGHPGVLKITSALQAEITGLKQQATERADRLAHIEEKQQRLLEENAKLSEQVRALDSIPTIVSRVATIESGMHFLLLDRDRRIESLIRQEDIEHSK